MTALRWPGAADRVLRVVGSTGFWAVAGRLVQIFGFGHAMRCMGHAGAGLSIQVMAAAMFAQVVLSLGIDVVAVRHVAARTRTLEELLPVIFTFRLVLHVAVALAAALLLPFLVAESAVLSVWLCGCLLFVVLGMNFQWYYQARGEMTALSRIQTLGTLTVSLCFFLLFRPGRTPAGSDLLVMALVHGSITAWIWWRAGRRGLWTRSFLTRALGLAREGSAMWLFGLVYNALAVVGLFLMPVLMAPEEGQIQNGLFRRSYQPCLALQFILTYIGYIFYPRIVVWKDESDFRSRVLGLALGGVVLGVLCHLSLLWLGDPVFLLIYRDTEGVGIFPVMAAARFIGMSSGFLVWGLLARHRDWAAVVCCTGTLCVSLVLHCHWLGRGGHVAAGWICYIGEVILFLACALVYLRGERGRRG